MCFKMYVLIKHFANNILCWLVTSDKQFACKLMVDILSNTLQVQKIEEMIMAFYYGWNIQKSHQYKSILIVLTTTPNTKLAYLYWLL
jgi:hypothetical protein